MFGKKKDVEPVAPSPQKDPVDNTIVVCGSSLTSSDLNAFASVAPSYNFALNETNRIPRCFSVISVFQSLTDAGRLFDQVIELRKARQDGTPVCILGVSLDQLKNLGLWLHERASSEKLEGMRLIIAPTIMDAVERIREKLEPVHETNIIRMPLSPEVENSGYKYFYCFSSSLRGVVRFIKQLAENNVSRIYLLGGPGAGKTSLAYYYYLCRGKGNFIAVNLSAESTGDKAAMKSLLCGHVTGAMQGSPQREGALTFARDGVCFLDESHGVTGVVMQVLMEVLDNGQFLPLGATMKRTLECAVIFASNRSWDALRAMIHLDEHARLGATIVTLQDLAQREEDLMAVAASCLGGFSKQCTTWQPAEGITESAWQTLLSCPWRGNTRTLMRVLETACVSFAREGSPDGLIDERHVRQGLDLWEPEQHNDHDLFVSFAEVH